MEHCTKFIREKLITFKVGFKKSYGKINWDILLELLMIKGFPERDICLIRPVIVVAVFHSWLMGK
jgi:hypothetical protein